MPRVSDRIHHLNCGTMCPRAARIPGLMPSDLVAHCLLIEGADGLTLVDTGFGTLDIAEQSRRLGRVFTSMVGAAFDPDERAVAQVAALGHDPRDVRDVVVTHLDPDHAGGLSDFPWARVHVHPAELSAATRPSSLNERLRYVPAQWDHEPQWTDHASSGEEWHGFGAVRAVGDDLLMIPLHGHTRGHCGVAVRRPGGGWLLHAGDAYFFTGDKVRPRSCPPGLRSYQAALAVDGSARRANLSRLQELHASDDNTVTMFCAHDRSEFQALAGRSA